jgi:DnaB helicase-like protein/uncharacterized protein DUF3987
MSKGNFPHNLEAERALLGSILFDPAWLDSLGPKISADYFFAENHRRIYESMLRVRANKQPVDLVTVSEDLSKSGTLDNAGGAGYIAALTDGIAFGVKSSVNEYVHILREKRNARKLIHVANNVLAKAMSGEQIADLAALLKVEAEEIASRSNGHHKAAPSTEGIVKPPTLPPSAWPEMAERYRDIISPTTNAPDSFHLASFLTAVGAALGRSISITISELIFPNLWTVLVGEAGSSRKGTAMKKATRAVRAAVPEVETFRSIDSAEGVAKNLAPIQGKDVEAEKRKPAIFHLSELRTFLNKAGKKGLENLIPKMCEAYDGDPLEGRSVNSPVEIPEPFIAMIAGSSKPYIRSFRRADLEGGFGSRLAFVFGQSKKPIAKPPRPVEPDYSNLIIDVRSAVRYWRDSPAEISMDEKADKLWTAFYEDELPKLIPDDDFLRILGNRSEHFAVKVALISAALERAKKIQARHLACGIQFSKYALACLRFVFDDYDVAEWVQDERKILEVVKKHPEGIRRRELQKLFWRVGAERFNRHLKAMTEGDGSIMERRIGQQVWVYWVGD